MKTKGARETNSDIGEGNRILGVQCLDSLMKGFLSGRNGVVGLFENVPAGKKLVTTTMGQLCSKEG